METSVDLANSADACTAPIRPRRNDRQPKSAGGNSWAKDSLVRSWLRTGCALGGIRRSLGGHWARPVVRGGANGPAPALFTGLPGASPLELQSNGRPGT